YLGASTELHASDVDEALVADSFVTYLEGYLWDRPEAKEAFVHASELAHAHGRKVALTLSDPFCVERHRESFLELVDGHIDVLFANEHEIMHLYQSPSFEEAMAAVRGKCEIAVLTRSEQGAYVIRGDEEVRVLARPVERVVDTTGAGDLFAAGFLFGLARGKSLEECGRIAAIAAAEVISHIG